MRNVNHAGRVGALALALGVGAAMAATVGAGTASADPQSGSSTSSNDDRRASTSSASGVSKGPASESADDGSAAVAPSASADLQDSSPPPRRPRWPEMPNLPIDLIPEPRPPAERPPGRPRVPPELLDIPIDLIPAALEVERLGRPVLTSPDRLRLPGPLVFDPILDEDELAERIRLVLRDRERIELRGILNGTMAVDQATGDLVYTLDPPFDGNLASRFGR
ncbi:hypothetical protein JRC04_11630 [Mycolicibacterium sp. S2-37]|uniref:hypothetical protein n=1 Tax=Mycolicibacterium sp. S2-37 TaxID=2810297 RepID=UPI001A94BE00|nr:hypothetical protein [Mycolicibacterium sp. S2-37]MBO0678115.1 hypothetical protein [Mycolicibacterium sp. S2-37]